MSSSKTFQDKVEAKIRELLREEFPFTHTSTINEVSSTGAWNIVSQITTKYKRALSLHVSSQKLTTV